MLTLRGKTHSSRSMSNGGEGECFRARKNLDPSLNAVRVASSPSSHLMSMKRQPKTSCRAFARRGNHVLVNPLPIRLKCANAPGGTCQIKQVKIRARTFGALNKANHPSPKTPDRRCCHRHKESSDRIDDDCRVYPLFFGSHQFCHCAGRTHEFCLLLSRTEKSDMVALLLLLALHDMTRFFIRGTERVALKNRR